MGGNAKNDALAKALVALAANQTPAQAVQAAAAPSAVVPAAVGPRPGDPGWTFVPPTAPLEPAGPPRPPVTGPVPGDKNFSIMSVPGAAAPPPPPPKGTANAPAPKLTKPLPLDQQIAASNASVAQGNAMAQGKPFVSNAVADKIAASNSSIEAARGKGPESGIVFAAPEGQSATVQPTIVPAHEVPLVSPERQAAEQEAYGVKEDAVTGEQEAIDKQKDAEDRLANAKAQANLAKEQGDRDVAEAYSNADISTRAQAQADKDAHDEFLSRMDQFSEDLANDKIGVNASLPRTITWGLARAFGAVQQGLLHLPTNQIADHIDHQISQEIENQKANHSIKRNRLHDMQNFYGYAVQQSKDQAEQMRLARGYGLEAAKAEAQALADAAQTPIAQAEAEKLKAALTEKQAQLGEHKADVGIAKIDRGIAENKYVAAGPAGGAGKPVDTKMVFYDPVTGQRYAAHDEDSRKKLTESGARVLEMKQAAADYRDALEQLSAAGKIAGKAGWDTAAMSKAQTAYNHLVSIPRQAQNDGVWKKSEVEMIANTLHPPTQLSGDIDAQISQLNKQVLDVHKSQMRTQDPTPVVAAEQPVGAAPKNVPTGQTYAPPKQTSQGSVGFQKVGAKAKGGSTDKDQPYLVGEKGPELVVPDKPGFVMTALQTAALRGAPPTQQQIDTLPAAHKTALQRWAEKAGVSPARADGGEVLDARQSEFAPDPEDDPNGYGRFDMPVRVGMPPGPGTYEHFDENPGVLQDPNAANAPQWMNGYMAAQAPTDPYARDINADNHEEAQRILAQNAPPQPGAPKQPTSIGEAAQQQADEKAGKKKGNATVKKAGGSLKDIGEKMEQQNAGGGGLGSLTYQDFAFRPRALGGAIGGMPNISQPGGTEMLGHGGGMDVMGSLQANNAAAMQYMKPGMGGFAREEGGVIQRWAKKAGAKLDAAHDAVYDGIADAAGRLMDRSPDPTPSAQPFAGEGEERAHAPVVQRREEGGPVSPTKQAAKYASYALMAPVGPAQLLFDEAKRQVALAPRPSARPVVPAPAASASSPVPRVYEPDARAQGGPMRPGLASTITRDLKKSKRGC